MKFTGVLFLTIITSGISEEAVAHDHWLIVSPVDRMGNGIWTMQTALLLGEHFKDAEPVLVSDRSRYDSFVMHYPDGRRQDKLPGLQEVDSIILDGWFDSDEPQGTYMLTLNAKPRDITLEANKFNSYLREEELNAMLANRMRSGEMKETGRERYSRSLKTLFRVGNGPVNPGVIMNTTGQELDIVPLIDPYVNSAEYGVMGAQVLLLGEPLTNHRVIVASRRYSGGAVFADVLRTDVRGMVAFPLIREGRWMIRVLAMHRYEPPVKRGDPVYRSFWSTLTFSFEK